MSTPASDPPSLRHGRPAARAIGWAALALLGGCGLFARDPGPPPACPAVQVLPRADALSAYAPGRRGEAAGLHHVAGIADLAGSCRSGRQGLELDLAFNLLVEPGPAFDGGPVGLTWFVATLGPGQRIQSKQLFTSEVSLPAGQQVAGQREELTLRLPGIGADEAAGYELYVGFQLDEVARRRDRPLIGPGPQIPPEDGGEAPSASP